MSATALSTDRAAPAFKGLMALLAGHEKAMVDLRYARSAFNPETKNYNIDCAIEALSAGLVDFKRGDGV